MMDQEDGSAHHSSSNERDQLDFEIADDESTRGETVSISETLGRLSGSVAMASRRTVQLVLARWTLGIILMLITISMWTVSNFLASSIFADNSYSKPYFVTWLNVSFFSVFLLRPLAKRGWQIACSRIPFLPGYHHANSGPILYSAVGASSQNSMMKLDEDEDEDDEDDHEARARSHPTEGMYLDESMVMSAYGFDDPSSKKLKLRETIRLALPFAVLWFLSNFFVSACLKYTTVASSTVLGATGSAFTLAFGAIFGAEKFTVRKLIGVAVCLLGVVMISQVDLSGGSDENRGTFPEKSTFEMAVGDMLALTAAIFYALYTILLKKQVGDESRLDVFTFFGFIGLFNILLIWPGLVILHFTGLEEFEMPPTSQVWWIVICNGLISVISDVCWTYSMLLTSPLVISVGLSLAIPMSILGQMIVNGQSSSFLYWIGSVVVVASFLLINQENKHEADEADQAALFASISSPTMEDERPSV